MNKKFDELYKYLLDQNMTDLSPEDFKSKYSTGKTFDELYSQMVDKELTDLSSVEFNNIYFGEGDYVTKKKEEPKDEPYDLYKKSITTLPKEDIDASLGINEFIKDEKIKEFEEKMKPNAEKQLEIDTEVNEANMYPTKVHSKVSVGGVGTGMPLHTVDKVTEVDKYKDQRERAEKQLGKDASSEEVGKLAKDILRIDLENEAYQKKVEETAESGFSYTDLFSESIKGGAIYGAYNYLTKHSEEKAKKIKESEKVLGYKRDKKAKVAEKKEQIFNANYARLEEKKNNLYLAGSLSSDVKNFFEKGSTVSYDIPEGEAYYEGDGGRKIPKSIVDEYRKLEADINTAAAQASLSYDEYSKSLEDIDNVDAQLAMWAKDTNQFKRNMVTLGVSGLSTAKNIVYGAAQLQNVMNPMHYALKSAGIWDNQKALADVNLVIDNALTREKDSYNFLAPTAFGDISNLEDGIDWSLNMTMETLPIMGAMILSGGSASSGLILSSVVAGASSAGGKFTEMDIERDKLDALKQKDPVAYQDMIDQGEDISDLEYGVKGMMYAVIEGSSAYFTTSAAISNGYSVFRGSAGVEDKLFANARSFLWNKAKETFKDGNWEGIGELYVNIGQNLVDGRPTFQGSAESFTGGFMFGTMFTAPSVMKGIASRDFSTESEIIDMQRNIKEVNSIRNEIGNLQKEGALLFYEPKTKENITRAKEIKDQKRSLIDLKRFKLNSIKEQVDSKQKQLTKEGITLKAGEYYSSNQAELAQLRQEAEEIAASKADKETKKKLITNLDVKYKELNNQQNKFKSKELFGHKWFGMVGKSQYDNEANQEVNDITQEAVNNIIEKKKKPGYIPSPEEISTEAVKIVDSRDYDVNLKKANRVNKAFGTETKNYNTNKEGAQAVRDYYISRGQEALGEKYAKEVEAGNANGFFDPTNNVSWNFKENAVANQKPGVPLHEAAHSASRNLMDSNPEAFKDLLNSIVKQLEINNPDLLLKMRVEGTGGLLDESGKSYDLDEVFSSFIEEVAAKRIKLDDGYLAYFGKLLNQGLKKADPNGEYDIDFKGENDIENFLTTYGKLKIKTKKQIIDIDSKKETKRREKIAASETKAIKESKTAPVRSVITSLVGEKKELIADQIKMVKDKVDDDTKKAKNVARIKDINKQVEILEDIETIRLAEGNTTRADNRLYQNTKDEVNKTARAITNSPKFFSGIAPEAATQGMGVSTYKEARQLYETTLQSDLSTMIKNEWNPEIEPDLGTFVRNRGYLRAYSLATRLGVADVSEGGIGITKDLETAKDIMVEEDIDAEVKPTTEPVLLHKRLGQEAESINTKIRELAKDIDPNNITYKTLKDLTPDLTQEMFGISPKPGNLTKTDIKNAQMFIAKNADVLIAMLPEGATPSGTATGVQNVLLKEFYTKKDRAKMGKTGSAAGLAIQVKKPNINKSDFLEVFGITQKGEQNLYKKESNTSSRIKALVEQTGRLMTNQAVRQEMIEQNVPEAIVQKLSEGKSKVMFSSSKNRQGVGVAVRAATDGDLTKQEVFWGGVPELSAYLDAYLSDDSIGRSLSDVVDSAWEKTFNNIPGFDFRLKGRGKAPNSKMKELKQSFVNTLEPLVVKSKKLSKQFGDVDIQEFIFTEVDKANVLDNTKAMIGLGKGSIDFRNKTQLTDFAGALSSWVNSKANSVEDILDIIVNQIGPTLYGSAKIGSNDFMWKLVNGVPTLTDGGNPNRGDKSTYGIAENAVQLFEILGLSLLDVKTINGEPFSKFNRESIVPKKGETTLIELASGDKITIDWKKIKTKKGSGWQLNPPKLNGESTKTSLVSQGRAASTQILKEVKKNLLKGDQGISNETLEKRLIDANRNRDIFISILDYKKSNPDEFSDNAFGMFLTSANLGSGNSILRASANVNGYGLEPDADFAANGYRFEHNPPARVMTVYATQYINGEISLEELIKKFDDFTVNIIPLKMDGVLDLKYKSSLPLSGLKWDRYFSPYSYGEFNNSIVYYEKQGGNWKRFEQGEFQYEAYKEVQSSKKNNTQLVNYSKVIKESSSKLVNTDILSLAATIDAAISNARKTNAPVKKIRVFDFDDTLARTASRVIYKKPNATGKPQPKLKAVMLAGSPGAGKSSVVKSLGLEQQGYKIVNQDISLEWVKKLVGLSESEADYDAVERSKRSELGGLARKIAERKLDKFTTAGNGVVIDGTGASLKATKAKIQALKDLGYDVKMVYVETSKAEAVKRNAARKERSLKDFIVEKSWDSVDKNKGKYKELFGEDFFDLNTEGLKEGTIPKEFKDKVNNNLNAFEKGRLAAGSFAEVGTQMESEGATFDFTEFNRVVDGKEGPLLEIAKKIQEARGTEDVFVLTARAQESAGAIKEFLSSVGLDLPLKNITGLGDSSPFAKSQWVVERAAEGYNDFYFADDHGANVEAVRDALEQLPVKSKVQQAKPKTKFSFDTKRDLKWKPMGPSQSIYANDVQVVESTEWDIKGKKYGMYIERLYGEMLEAEISFLADKGLLGEKQGVDIQKLQEYIFNEGMDDINYNVGMDMGFFKLEKSADPKREFEQVSEITETGDSQAIFSVVINGLKEKINKDKKAGINYQLISYAAKVEGGRPSLYRLFAREFGRQLGSKVIEEPMYRTEYTADGFPVKMIEEGPFAYKFYLIKESLFEEADALIKPVEAKFSLNTKQKLIWKKHENKRTYPNTSEAEFVINNKDYLMDVDAKDVGSIFQKLEDQEYADQLEQAGYNIEAIEDRLSNMELGKGPKPKIFDTGFYKLEEMNFFDLQGAVGTSRTRDVDITGSGDAAEVLSVVVNGLVDKYKSTKGVVGLQFTSYEANRTSLYRRIANLFAEELNLEVLQSKPTVAYGTDFFLVDKDLLGERKKLTELDAKPEVKFSLDTSKKLKWKSRSEESDIATFKSEGQDYFIATDKDIFSNTAVFEFGTYDADLELDYDLTNIGNSREVFGTVINGMIDYIKKNKIDTVRFNSTGYKRTRLYTSMARVFAKQLGWNWKAYFPFKNENLVNLKWPHSYGEFEMSEYALPIEKDNEVGNWSEKDFKTKFSLNTKRDLKWVTDAWYETDYSAFKVKDKAYIVKVGRTGEVTFGLVDKKLSSKSVDEILNYTRLYPHSGGLDLGMTKTGDAAEIISIVSNGLLEYIKKNDTKELRFTSEGTGRTRVYKRLIKHFAGIADMNYTWDIINTQKLQINNSMLEVGIIQNGKFKVSKSKLPQPKEESLMSEEEYKADTQQRIREALGRNAGEPVQEALNVVDRNRPQQVRNRTKFSSTNMSRKFNMILEESTGVEHYKVFSEAKGRVIGAGAKRQRFFIPPSAEDFQGLLYPTLGKGAVGEKHQKFYEQALFKPYNRGVSDLASDRAALMTDFKALKKTLKVPKDLRNKTKSGFTNEQAVRVWLWNKTEQEVPGISKGDLSQLLQIVESDNKLRLFGEEILALTKNDGYSTPKQHWLTGTITTDLIDLLNTTKRAKYLKQWQENSDAMFTKENLNKLEAIYGPKYREALEGSLRAMKTGRNRGGTNSRLSNAALDYVNGSVGVIMFTNMRSALLQGISMVNFVNWDFNNPLKAGGAFLNLPQFAKDFSHIMNSKYLTDRRNGLKLNIHENEIANAAKTSKNKAAAIINLIIEKGYSPTKFMDSFAIAFGGATYYRNRTKDLMKKNPKLSIEEAQERAFEEMRDISEKTQQSSDPSKISQQQRSDLGRLVLQFVNTPMQYARLQKRAVQDLANGRGNPKEHISKLIYYGFVQNLIFNGLQQALFAFGFEDDEKKVEAALPKKTMDIANGMLDSSLRGLGLAGVTVGVLKNLVLDVYERSQKDRPEYQDAWIKLLQFSPAISSKIKRLKNAGWAFDSKDRRKMIKEEGFSIDNPAVEAGANVVSAVTNVPTDRILKKVNNLRAIAKDETELWMDIALFLGWPEWQLTIPDTPEQVKAKKKAERKSKSKSTRKKGGYSAKRFKL